MAKPNLPVTAAIRVLREHGVAFVPHPYEYQPRGGTAHSAQCLGVDEHAVIKTLVMEDETATPLVVLMHGDRQVSTSARAAPGPQEHPALRTRGRRPAPAATRSVAPRRWARERAMPVYIERSILDLPRIYINGGRRGMLVELEPRALAAVLRAEPVDVATGGRGDAPR
ncbi:MAG: YbaK/EbsC family protein [Nannocystaceae bacterium]